MQINNISITASNGTTPVVYTAHIPQSGDTPALWYIQDNTKARALWPKLTTRVRVAKGNASTIVSCIINQPIEILVNGVNQVKYLTCNTEFTLSNSVPPAQYVEFMNNVQKLVAGQIATQVKNLEAAV